MGLPSPVARPAASESPSDPVDVNVAEPDRPATQSPDLAADRPPDPIPNQTPDPIPDPTATQTLDPSPNPPWDRNGTTAEPTDDLAPQGLAPVPTPAQPARSLLSIARVVAIATILSKLVGLVRQQAIAAAFGAGPVVDAYTYAYVLPGFLLILLGGINGPFHSAMVSVLAKRDRREAAHIVETVSTVVGVLLLGATGLLWWGAGWAIDLLAPGLGETTRSLAVTQLQWMAPIALLAGLIGIGFGTLNAADLYWLPSVSPVLSSAVTIVALGWYAWEAADGRGPWPLPLLGAVILAGSTTAGALLQLMVQLPAQAKAGLGGWRLRWDWQHPGVQEVFRVMTPAVLSAGMLQINLYTNLFFTSFIPQAAAALNYANLLVQTPLGVISNVVLVPLLPVMSRLGRWDTRREFKQVLRQGLVVSALTMLPLGAIAMTLAEPAVRIIYERGAFGRGDSQLVAAVFMASSLGMFVYLGRDVVVRAFYALGDGQTPFRISLINIFLNAGLDWLLVPRFGAPGVALATVGVNAVAMVALLALLPRRVGPLPWGRWLPDLVGLVGAAIICGLAARAARWGLEVAWGTHGLWVALGQVAIATGVGLGVFVVGVVWLDLPETGVLAARWRERFGK